MDVGVTVGGDTQVGLKWIWRVAWACVRRMGVGRLG